MNKKLFLLKKYLFSFPLFVTIVFLIVIPFCIIFYYALTKDGKISFINFAKFFSDTINIEILFSTFGISLFSSFICIVLSIPLVWLILKLPSFGRFFVLGLITIPMWLNMILKLKSFNTIFINNGFLEKIFDLFLEKNYDFRSSWPILVVGLIFVFLPFMIMPIYNSMSNLNISLIGASYDLGASKNQTFWKVILPQIYSGIKIGFSLVFLSSSMSLSFSYILTDSNFYMIGLRISRLYQTQKEYAALISILSVSFLLFFYIFTSYLTKKVLFSL